MTDLLSGAPRAIIVAPAGPALTAAERSLFAEADPLGFILFGRNVETPDQVRALVTDLRQTVRRPDAPVLIDQEGGRVARLKSPHWRDAPPMAPFGRLHARDAYLGRQAVMLNARLLAAELADLGIDVDCAPVVDVPALGAHEVIGDRAFSADPDAVADLARSACAGFLAEGVMPILKHIPGHGRATADSHHDLPVVDAPWDDLAASDFLPFRALGDIPWAMTAHVVYSAVDPDRCATLSPTVVAEVIRGHMRFDGILVTDDINMGAVGPDMAAVARDALAAGCDLLLHCSGDRAEMADLLPLVPRLSESVRRRLARGRARLGRSQPFDRARAARQVDAWVNSVM